MNCHHKWIFDGENEQIIKSQYASIAQAFYKTKVRKKTFHCEKCCELKEKLRKFEVLTNLWGDTEKEIKND